MAVFDFLKPLGDTAEHRAAILVHTHPFPFFDEAEREWVFLTANDLQVAVRQALRAKRRRFDLSRFKLALSEAVDAGDVITVSPGFEFYSLYCGAEAYANHQKATEGKKRLWGPSSRAIRVGVPASPPVGDDHTRIKALVAEALTG